MIQPGDVSGQSMSIATELEWFTEGRTFHDVTDKVERWYCDSHKVRGEVELWLNNSKEQCEWEAANPALNSMMSSPCEEPRSEIQSLSENGPASPAKPNSTVGKKTVVCYSCGKSGHYRDKCSTPAQDSSRKPNHHINSRPVIATRKKSRLLASSSMPTFLGDCYKCGKAGHRCSTCPRHAQNRSKEAPPRNVTPGGDHTNLTSRQSQMWKKTPPESQECEAKEVGGKMYFWCTTCDRWNHTHRTHQHLVRSYASEVIPFVTKDYTTTIRGNFDTDTWDKSAWIMDFSTEISIEERAEAMRYY